MNRSGATLRILNVLMNTEAALATEQIVERADVDRKTVYNAVDNLEINGFHIEVNPRYTDGAQSNRYRYGGLRGF